MHKCGLSEPENIIFNAAAILFHNRVRSNVQWIVAELRLSAQMCAIKPDSWVVQIISYHKTTLAVFLTPAYEYLSDPFIV